MSEIIPYYAVLLGIAGVHSTSSAVF